MENITIENWDLIRGIVAVLICVVFVLCMKQTRQPNFHTTLKKQFSNKKLKSIQEQVRRLEHENRRADMLLKNIQQSTGQARAAVQNTVKNPTVRPRVVATENDFSQKVMKKMPYGQTENVNPYDAVRRYAASGMSREAIYERMDMPQAEIDMLLKFNQMQRMQHLNSEGGLRQQAFG